LIKQIVVFLVTCSIFIVYGFLLHNSRFDKNLAGFGFNITLIEEIDSFSIVNANVAIERDCEHVFASLVNLRYERDFLKFSLSNWG
jgi:hypothetical protein